MTSEMQDPEVYAQQGSGAIPIFTEADEAQEKATLTREEVVATTSDIYGLADSLANFRISEDDDVPEALYMLDRVLQEMPRGRKTAFLEAQRVCPDLVDDTHKEAFLWAENLDATLAAERIVKYWEMKRELFGAEKCFLPLTLNGALKDDIGALKGASEFVLPGKDTAGRGIIFINGWPDVQHYDHKSLLRAFWYISSVAIQDPGVQKLGVIFLFFPQKGMQNPFNPEIRRFVYERFRTDEYLPMRVRAQHYIRPNAIMQCGLSIGKALMSKRLRQRIQVHSSTNDDEVLRNLERFGLPRAILPSEMGGPVVLEPDAWITSRLSLEKGSSCAGAGGSHGNTSGPDPTGCMNRAVKAKQDDPNLSNMEALLAGGFQFPPAEGLVDRDVIDRHGVSVMQRKNQLCRRLRKDREKKERESAESNHSKLKKGRNDAAP